MSTTASSAPTTSLDSMPTNQRKASLASLMTRRRGYAPDQLPSPSRFLSSSIGSPLYIPLIQHLQCQVRRESSWTLFSLHLRPVTVLKSQSRSAYRDTLLVEPCRVAVRPMAMPTIQASPTGSPGDRPHTHPELGRWRTSPDRSRGGIVSSHIPPASAPIERTVAAATETDYFGSASPHLYREKSYNSQSSSSRTATAGTPLPPKSPSPEPPDSLSPRAERSDSLSPDPDPSDFLSPEAEVPPPPVAESSEIGPLYERLGWLPAPLPPNEVARRKALYTYNILHTAKDVNFDRIAHMAKLVFNTKIVLIALIDAETQWYKAETGLGVEETGRISSFCSHAVLARQASCPVMAADRAGLTSPLSYLTL